METSEFVLVGPEDPVALSTGDLATDQPSLTTPSVHGLLCDVKFVGEILEQPFVLAEVIQFLD